MVVTRDAVLSGLLGAKARSERFSIRKRVDHAWRLKSVFSSTVVHIVAMSLVELPRV